MPSPLSLPPRPPADRPRFVFFGWVYIEATLEDLTGRATAGSEEVGARVAIRLRLGPVGLVPAAGPARQRSRRLYSTDTNATLRLALDTLPVMGPAQGVLMARQSISPGEAFDVLRRASQRTNRKLRDVAAEIVEGVSRTREGQGAPMGTTRVKPSVP